jgi:hypothetical protein
MIMMLHKEKKKKLVELKKIGKTHILWVTSWKKQLKW